MLNLGNIMIGTSDSEKLASFYEKVFDKKAEMEEDGWYGWMAGSTFFSIGNHSEVNGTSKEKDRIIFNFETSNVKEEFERIKEIGATVVKEPYEMGGAWIATFEDPDGNRFQLMTPWEEPDTKN